MAEPTQAAAVDDTAFEELILSMEPKMRSVLGWFGIPAEDRDDLIQQSFLTYLYRREEVRDPQAWILATLRRSCLMFWRRRRRRLHRQVDEVLLETVADDATPTQDLADLRSDIGRVLCGLPERCRSLLELRYNDGLSPAEAAESLGYRASGIYKILDRCLDALCRGLAARGFERGASG